QTIKEPVEYFTRKDFEIVLYLMQLLYIINNILKRIFLLLTTFKIRALGTVVFRYRILIQNLKLQV
ncbi:MAG: hypothetical protein OEZ18_06790, partial [Candidatus Bathyarchaeota archaeon]|nr:hypothetical protein [Candidatus Bathyarchaeota archaeon]